MIMEQVRLSKYKVLKCCQVVRTAMIKDRPSVFEGIVEVDETYIGGNWRNKNKGQKKKEENKKIVREAYGEIAQKQGEYGYGTCGPDIKSLNAGFDCFLAAARVGPLKQIKWESKNSLITTEKIFTGN